MAKKKKFKKFPDSSWRTNKAYWSSDRRKFSTVKGNYTGKSGNPKVII